MKLYYAPGACSLADHIGLLEAGLAADYERVDLKTKRTASGADFISINPKGYVPVLITDDGDTITENIAVLSWIVERAPQLAPQGPLRHVRLLEQLTFISTELHANFHRLFGLNVSGAEFLQARAALEKRFELIADTLKGPYLFGERFTVADAYLFVMLRWAKKFDVHVPSVLDDYFYAVMTRASVRRALAEET